MALTLFDAEAFEEDIRTAHAETKPSAEEEEQHLASLEFWTTALGLTGIVLMVRGVFSPLAMLTFGLYKFAKFAILAHHSLHGGWGRSRRGWYAQGAYRRVVDWLDWIFPLAWIVEHNKIHHYHLNEDADPDFVERNTKAFANKTGFARYMRVSLLALTWKWSYYASNTLKLLHAEKPHVPTKSDFEGAITIPYVVVAAIKGDPWYRGLALDLFHRVMFPPFFVHFLVIPFVVGLLRGNEGVLSFCWCTFVNMIGAEVATNVHAFCMIVTNHAGEDLWAFDCPCKPSSAEFYLRATLGSAAYHAGSDLVDYFHGYLNYQCEHHAFPDASPLHYQRLHPRFKQVCATHGVPYVQEPFWVRTRKTVDIMVGAAKHKRLSGLAVEQPELWNTKAKKAM